MAITKADYPEKVWDGLSEDQQRESREDNIEPSGLDYKKITSEVIALEQGNLHTFLSQYTRYTLLEGEYGYLGQSPLQVLGLDTSKGSNIIPVEALSTFSKIIGRIEYEYDPQIDDFYVKTALKMNDSAVFVDDWGNQETPAHQTINCLINFTITNAQMRARIQCRNNQQMYYYTANNSVSTDEDLEIQLYTSNALIEDNDLLDLLVDAYIIGIP